MRSRTGCLTCRTRKLKCDEKKPNCGQCCKASRECVLSSGLVFRHQHNASMNGEDAPDENSLKGFYAYKNTFDDDNVWLDIPKQVTFINTSNPYLDPHTPDFDAMSTSSMDSPAPVEHRSVTSWPSSGTMHTAANTPPGTGPQHLPPSATSASLSFCSLEPDALSSFRRPSMLLSPPTSNAGTPISTPVSAGNYHFNSSLSHKSMTPPPSDHPLASPFDQIPELNIPRSVSMSTSSTSCPSIDGLSETNHEVAFLLRWFSEGPGYWMDLFDLGTYFASYVPVKARENPLLKYAAVACSAKSLAQVQGRKPIMGGSTTRQACMELYAEAHSVDWYHKAAQYYDTAVSLLLQALKDDAVITPGSESPYEAQAHSSNSAYDVDGVACKRSRTSSGSTIRSHADEVLAASAILCVYEFLDASVPEWAKHLNGAKSLLIVAQDRMMSLQPPAPKSTITSSSSGFISKARRATFWNIARQDMLAAFINKTHTRLDTEDLSLWKEAGLLFDDEGYILPSNTTESGYPEGEAMMREDLICNALVWLMAKLVNFMAAGDDMAVETQGSWAAVSQRTLLDYWHHLKRQFQTWHDGLPVTFQSSARVEPRMTSSQPDHRTNEALFPEIWYSLPMCASTMQCYHMSQIQLLMNKPHESTQGRTTVVARMQSYQSVLAATRVHSREIVGISLARPDEAARIHSTQALFTAGQCLSDPSERRIVLKLLRDIESDIGWATEYRVQQLLQEWHLQEEASCAPSWYRNQT